MPISGLQISFWLKKESSNIYPGKFIVGIMTTASDTGSFVPVHTIEPNDASWHLYELDFQAYAGSGSYIAFKQEAVGSNHYYFLDDIVVSTYNPCRRPTNVTIDSVSSTEVTVRWSSTGIAMQWYVSVDTVGFTPGYGYFSEVASDTVWTIRNLSPNTQYQVYVQSECGTASDWSFPVTFSTSQQPITVPYIFDFEDDAENVNWGFANTTSDNKWHIGDVVHQGDEGSQALYISKNGTQHQYNNGSL